MSRRSLPPDLIHGRHWLAEQDMRRQTVAPCAPPPAVEVTMPFRVSGKNLDIGEALRTRVNARVAEAMAKYFDGGYSGHVTVGKDGFGFRTECAIHLDSGITLHTDGMAADAYSSADQAALRIEQRLR